uniref:POLN protein n=1 Tax=Fopius arisanus TaxID=64838 RepID=A0A0C9Q1Y2_9HYME
MMHSRGAAISSAYLYLLTVLLVSYGIYEVYHLEVNPEEFAVTHRQRIDARPRVFFNFFVQTHILEKLFPSFSRLKEADSRVLGVGKFYRAFWKLPLLGETAKIHLMVTDYNPPKFLALESEDQLIRQRVEIRFHLYHDRIILNVTIYSRRTSALFHYTVGRGLRHIFKNELRRSASRVAGIHRALQKDIIFFQSERCIKGP